MEALRWLNSPFGILVFIQNNCCLFNAFIYWQTPPSQDPTLVFSLLAHPHQQKPSLNANIHKMEWKWKCHIRGGLSSSWPAPHHSGIPDGFHTVGRETIEFSPELDFHFVKMQVFRAIFSFSLGFFVVASPLTTEHPAETIPTSRGKFSKRPKQPNFSSHLHWCKWGWPQNSSRSEWKTIPQNLQLFVNWMCIVWSRNLCLNWRLHLQWQKLLVLPPRQKKATQKWCFTPRDFYQPERVCINANHGSAPTQGCQTALIFSSDSGSHSALTQLALSQQKFEQVFNKIPLQAVSLLVS